jgi:hypothetical protein
LDSDGSDLFVHYEDLAKALHKAQVNKETLLHAKYGYTFYFSFIILTYYGKHNLSRKAVDLELLRILGPQPNTAILGS